MDIDGEREGWSAATLRPTPGDADTTSAAAPDMPSRIGRYLVLHELGAGGMGVVYAAYDPELDRKVALKLMYAEVDGARAQRSQTLLLREAQALAKLSHPNIVAIHDIGVYAGQVFVAMEFVAGQTVRRWREQAPRSWQDVVDVFVQAGRGLLAAHAVGLVHRDVKPDNLLIGDDGRVRVADFGVARYNAPDDAQVATLASGIRPLATVAGRGTLVGTPPYMAPEQHDNEGVGPHSDQFGFCVALYEALHGVRPFAGDSPAALVAAIRVGDTCRGATPTSHPAWLEQAVVRGLAARPGDRWPSMQALLVVLTLTRAGTWARWRRRAVIAALVIIGAAALVLGARALQTSRARAQAEQAADERLKVVTAGIDRLLAGGRRAEAEATLQAFVGEPEHRATRAAIDAWLLWADRMDAAGDRVAAQSALVEAYTGLPADDPREPAIDLRIAGLLRARWQYDELATLTRHAGERWPAAVAAPTWSRLRADAAAARRDLAGLLAEIDGGHAGADLEAAAPLLRALDAATFTGVRANGAHALDLDGDGVFEIATIVDLPRGGSLQLHRMDAALTQIHDFGLEHTIDASVINRWPLSRGPGQPGHLVGHRAGTTTLYELTTDGPRSVLAWADDRPASTAAADLDGDGVREFYVGTGSYTRLLHRLTRDAAGSWQRTPAHAATDALHSDYNALAVGDFDGDGRDELAVACGPWRAYDVRVLADDGRGIGVVARRRFGHVRAMTPLRGPDGATLLALTKDNADSSKLAFSPDAPAGEPPGLYVVRRRGEALDTVFHAPLPVPEGAVDIGHIRWLASGDLDGDGLDDIVARHEPPDPASHDFASLLLWRQRPDGSFVAAELGHVVPLTIGNFDADPASELVVHTPRGDGPELAVLGAGGAPLTAIDPPHVAATPTTLADPVLARAWARAEDLAGFGLYSAAADALERRISLAQTAADGREVQRRAAELRAAAGDHARAAAGHEALAQDGDVPSALAAMAGYEQALQLADALRMARGLAARTDLDAPGRTAVDAAVTRLAPALERRDALELRFDQPLAATWTIAEPLALRVDRVRGTLAVDAFADAGDLMTVPIDLSGGPLTIEFDLEVERAEWAAELAVEVRRDDTQILRLGVAASGGGGYLRRHSSFLSPESHGRHDLGTWPTDDPHTPSAHRLTVRMLPEQGKIDIVEAGDHPGRRTIQLEQPLRPGRATLALRSAGVASHGAQHMRAHVRRIAVAGARMAPALATTPDAAHDVARSIVTGHSSAAIDDGDPLHQALVAHARGRVPATLTALARLDPDDPTTRKRLRHLLRTDPRAWLPLLRAALGPHHAALLREALATATRMHLDPTLQRIWLTVAADLDDLPAADPAQRDTRAELLTMRAAAWRAVGDLEQATADLDAAAVLRETGAPAHDDRLADLEVRRAEIAAARGHNDAALTAATRALDRSTTPGAMAERLRMGATLASMQTDPRWQRLLSSHAGR